MVFGSAVRRGARGSTALLIAAASMVPATLVGAATVASTPSSTTSDAGFEVTERSVTIDPQRTVRIEHAGDPELLILPDVASGTTLAIRSHDGDDWTDWVEVSADPDEAPDSLAGEEGDGTTPGIGPIWIGHDAARSEIAVVHGDSDRIEVEELDIDDAMVAAPPTSATTSGPSNVRAYATADDATAPDEAPAPGSDPDHAIGSSASDSPTTMPRPAIRPRSDWATSSMGWRCGSKPGESDNITAAVVHHTATTTDYAPGDVPAILRAFWRYHAESNGWCDIAYNFLVDRYGTIWEGRQGGVDRPVIGGHAKGFNTRTTGVAMIGDFNSSPAYSAMVRSASDLLAWKLSLHGVDPLGWTELQNRATTGRLKYPANALVHVPTVLGHRDLGLTSCPGRHLYDEVGAIRRALATPRRVGSPPHVFDRWSPTRAGIAVATIDDRGGIRVAGSAGQTPVTVSGTPVAIEGGAGRGYVLTTDGRLTPFNGAPSQPSATAGAPVDLAVRSDGSSGWVLDRNGRLDAFGSAPPANASGTDGRAIAVSVDDAGRGYVVSSVGRLSPVNGAPARSTATSPHVAIDVVVRADGASGWVLRSDGSVQGFGGAPSHARPTGSGAARALVLAGDEAGVEVFDAEGRLWPVGGAAAVVPVASHVTIPNAVDAGRIERAGLPSTDLGRVVTALHELFLEAAPAGPAFDKWFHTAERSGRVQASLGMARSDQYAGLIIDDLYRRVLDRDADPGGRAGWLGAIRGGMRIETIASAFYGSAEYVQRAGSTDRYVELLYENLLFRASDPGGKDNWTTALRTRRLTPTQVAAGFYGSLESRRDRVTRLYDRILRRDPDPGGLEHWAERLITLDDLYLAAELAGSREFYNRVLEGTR